jgi:predicted DNA-binding transcriptional regulator AlpA
MARLDPTRLLLLERAVERLEVRLLAPDRQIESGDEAAWPEYLEVAQALATIAPAVLPERTGRLLTSAEMARRLGISEKTLHRHRQQGRLAEPVELGPRGRGRAVRWRGTEAG